MEIIFDSTTKKKNFERGLEAAVKCVTSEENKISWWKQVGRNKQSN